MFAIISVLVSLSFTSCRYSDTLLEIVPDPDGIVDEHVNPVYHEVEGAPENTELASVHLSENDNLADQSNFLPVYKEDAALNGQAMRRIFVQDNNNTNEAVQGDISNDNMQANTATSKEQDPQDDTNSSSEGQSTEDQQETGNSDSTRVDRTSGRGGEGKVFGNGDYDELPEVRSVAAKGQYALITQMLAGKGGLAAADATWLQDMKNRGVFPGEGLDSVPAVWDASGALNIEALIASSADAILVDGVSVALTDAQRSALTSAGFQVITVPPLDQTYTQDKDIVTAVKVVGQILSGLNSDATYATADMVERYIQQHDTAINGCLNANGGYSYKIVAGRAFKGIYQGTAPLGDETSRLSQTRITTACIDSWTGTSASSMKANREFGFHELPLNGTSIDLTDGVGLSAQVVGKNCVLTDYYLQTCGVVNNAYDNVRPVSVKTDSEDSYPYAVMAGSSDGVTPKKIGVREIPSALWYSQTGISLEDRWITVGESDFPGVIVRDEDIANKVRRSASKSNGLYNVGQSYQIYQIPNGIAGNWYDGNVESYLTSVWAYGVFREGTMTGAKEWVDAFYQLFYRVNNGAEAYLRAFDARTTAG